MSDHRFAFWVLLLIANGYFFGVNAMAEDWAMAALSFCAGVICAYIIGSGVGQPR